MKQVLVVDDSAVIRKVARRILEGLHFRTSEASDGKLGLARCENNDAGRHSARLEHAGNGRAGISVRAAQNAGRHIP